MMRILLLTMLTLCILNVNAQEKKKLTEGEMKQYYFVMLSKGAKRDQDSATAAKIQKGHMDNMKKLYEEKKLVMAGPFGDDGDWRGIFIFDVPTKEEVEQLVKTDPAIISGRLSYEIHPWWSQRGICLP